MSIRKVLALSGKFNDYLESLRTVWKVLALSGKVSTGWKVLLQFLELCLVFLLNSRKKIFIQFVLKVFAR